MKTNRVIPFSLPLLMLAACAPAPSSTDDAAPAAVEPLAQAPAIATAFNTTSTVRELMRAMVAPNAERVWNAISYSATADGVTETMPQTDADWASLRASAVSLIEAGNALMLPGRAVDLPENAAATPDYQYRPAEIADMIRVRESDWIGLLQDMQEYTLATLEAIDARDPLMLTERSALINEACEACHAMFWYTPVPMIGNEGIR